MFEDEDVRLFLRPQIGYLAKSNGEQLWMHHYSVYKICTRLLDYLPAFPEKLREPLSLACLLHDVGKMRREAQEILEKGGGGGRVVHKPREEEFRDYISWAEGLCKALDEDTIKAAYDISVTHHHVSDEDIIKNTTAYSSTGILLLRVSDWLASMEKVHPETLDRIVSLFTMPGSDKPFFTLTYFEIGREPGPSTSIIADEALDAFEKNGFKRLVLFPNAAVLVGQGSETTPERGEIAASAYDRIRRQHYAYIQPDYGTRNLFIGFVEENPRAYLEVHRKKILEDLASAEKRGSAFFKLLAELMTDLGRGPGSPDNTWEMNVIHGFATGRNQIRKRGEEWEESRREKLPRQKNGNFDRKKSFDHFLGKLSVRDLLGREYLLDISKDIQGKPLNKLTSEQLFEILISLASKVDEGRGSGEGKIRELEYLLSLPEEKDFTELAKGRFEAYLKYKRRPKPEIGVCEMCGSAFTQKVGTEAPDGATQCFSYVKSNPNIPRAICYLCSYDLAFSRKQEKKNQTSINLWVSSRVDVESEYLLGDIIFRLSDDLNKIRNITRMVDAESDLGLPFPPGLQVPVSKKTLEATEPVTSLEKRIFRTRFGLFIHMENVAANEFSVKDMRARYALIYDILNFLGYETCITNDLEFRQGLFGERRLSTLDNYYQAISVVLLSKVLDRQKKHASRMAMDIIATHPSLAIRKAFETDGRDKPILNADQMRAYIKGLVLADREVVRGGGLTMGELLDEAAFFARNIHRFCVKPEEKRDFWNNLTKHKATKPVQAAFNQMMRGRDFDVAMSAFLSYISDKIAKEDRNDLDAFADRSKKIFRRYYYMRERDFSGFLKAKNALMNGIYVFTRYKDLDLVFQGSSQDFKDEQEG
jgi:hypothetical protein